MLIKPIYWNKQQILPHSPTLSRPSASHTSLEPNIFPFHPRDSSLRTTSQSKNVVEKERQKLLDKYAAKMEKKKSREAMRLSGLQTLPE